MRSNNPLHYLLYLNLALLIILLLEIGFYFLIFPKVAVNKIELESDLVLSDAEVRHLLGFSNSQNYYSVDVEEMMEYARNFALIDEISIRKEFPDLLKVRLKSRKPVLVMLQKNTEQSVPILVDIEGVMFQVGLGSYDDVPILSGLEFSEGNPLNSRLPSRLHPLVEALGMLQEEHPGLYTMISEIRAKMNITDLETDIYLEEAPSYIKTSGTIDAHTIKTALIALEVLKRSREKTEFLDMRTTGIVYRPSLDSGLNSSEERTL